MTGLTRRDRLGWWGPQALVLLGAGTITATSLRWLDCEWIVLAAVVVGWLVASVTYVTASILVGRMIGIATAMGVVAVGCIPGWGKWLIVTGAVLVVATLIILRATGARKADVVPTDRTGVSTLLDEGNRLVDAMDGIWGSSRADGPRCGLRAAHTHGSLATGQWKSTYGTATATHAQRLGVPLFASGKGGRAVARFSNFSGEIVRDDRKRAPHGLAIRLEGGDGGTIDLVLVDIQRFPSATREDFVALTRAFADRGLPRVSALAWLVFTGRTSIAALRGMRQRSNVSYTQRTYFGLNTFHWRLDNRANAPLTPVRYVARPRNGGGRLSLGAVSVHGLDHDLRERLRTNGPVWFDIELEVARTTGIRRLSRARLLSPLERWPRHRRERRPLFSLELTTYAGTEDVGLRFDALRLPEGVEPSDDEILRARAAAYATSYLRRSSADRVGAVDQRRARR